MKISILTPSFNSADYIERAITSVLKQDYKDWEHIIVDGGSKDNTIDILKKYDHLKWISEPDSGQSDAMNKAFNMSTGDIIVYLNADDEINKNAFASVVKEFENENIDMVVGDLEVVHLKENRKYIQTPSIKLQEVINFSKANVFPFNPVSYYYRREIQIKVGPFPIENYYTMDVWFLLHAYKHSKIKKINQVLGSFYNDGSNKTSNLYESILSKFEVISTFVKEDPDYDYDKWLSSFVEGYAMDRIQLNQLKLKAKKGNFLLLIDRVKKKLKTNSKNITCI